MQVGFNLRQLVETVQLLWGCNWTSTIAKQQHGSLAALKIAHPKYQEGMLVAREQVLATRRLLPKPTEDERLPARVTKKEALRTSPIESKVARRISLRWRATQVRPDAQDNRGSAHWSLKREGRERAKGLGEGGESHCDLSEEEPEMMARFKMKLTI